MRKFITTNIVTPTKAPITEKALRHINEMVGEPINSLVKSMIGSYTTNDLIILEGCSLTVTGSAPGNSTAVLAAGTIYYNGEVYLVDANASLTTTNPQTYTWVNDNDTVDSVDTKFTNNVDYEFLSIRKLKLIAAAAGSGLANYNSTSVKYYKQSTNTGFSVASSVDLTSTSVSIISCKKIGGEVRYTLGAQGTAAGSSICSLTIDCPVGFRMRRSLSDGGTNIHNGTIIRNRLGFTNVYPANGSSVTAHINASNQLVITDSTTDLGIGDILNITLDISGDLL